MTNSQDIREAEAKERWCPMMFGGNNKRPKCEGSSCMAWRWKETIVAQGDPNYAAAAGYTATLTEISTTHGHCGMATGVCLELPLVCQGR